MLEIVQGWNRSQSASLPAIDGNLLDSDFPFLQQPFMAPALEGHALGKLC